eukprot:TRINITY_DN17665_c0_g1_i15.p1 TRINITY_DN17665_c0_g1~~TRINITY_DN17665_c0_g1_i15.p1  ORF type:complete len:102 (-),score=9.53 TRINITY_DN17665_c0_g1_i15:2450-2755(-)
MHKTLAIQKQCPQSRQSGKSRPHMKLANPWLSIPKALTHSFSSTTAVYYLNHLRRTNQPESSQKNQSTWTNANTFYFPHPFLYFLLTSEAFHVIQGMLPSY